MVTDESIQEIVSFWGLKFQSSRPELDIAGSPERTTHRMVIDDQESRLWILEAIPSDSQEHKLRICRTLAYLHDRGLETVTPYLSDTKNRLLVHHGNRDWQIRPYVEGVPLPRPHYVQDEWRGRACARFLADLRERSRDIPFFDPAEALSMRRFIEEMSVTMEEYDPQDLRRLDPALGFVEREFSGQDEALPIIFCHGDFHPLNIVWSDRGLLTVIDWEFLGYKPEIYDMANLIGCVGFEDPAALSRGFVAGLISEMSQSSTVSTPCWEALPEWVIAIRFAWLSDWLRRRDREMIDLEMTYIYLLIENRRDLRAHWKREVGRAA
jgi:homoserine kinase type II